MSNITMNQTPALPSGEASQSSHLAQQALDVLDDVARLLGLPDVSSEPVRKQRYYRSRAVSNVMMEAVAAAASRHGGAVAGVPVNPDDVRASIAYAAAMEPVAVACDQFARRLRDHSLAKRYASAMRVKAAMAALTRLGELEDTGLRAELGAMRAAIPRRTKRAKVAGATAPVPPASTPK